MKSIIDRTSLLRPLGHVQSVVERRNTIPILSNVLLDASNGRLSLTATDMDMDIIESVDCNVLQEGTITVPAHTLYDIIRLSLIHIPSPRDVGESRMPSSA